MSANVAPLPSTGGTVKVRVLEGGFLHLPNMAFVTNASDPRGTFFVPDMCWLIHHAPSKTNLVFDLGVRKDFDNLPPAVHASIQKYARTEVPQDVCESLRQAGADPLSDIDTVIFSHLHWDHIGDPVLFGPRTSFVVGSGSLALLDGPNSFPANPNGEFNAALLPRERTVEMPHKDADLTYWAPLGPFPHAHDWFGDASVFVVDAPGHLDGHVNLLVRDEVAGWMLLAGDAAHSPDILSGKSGIATYMIPGTTTLGCAHVDKEAAELHIKRMRVLQSLGVDIVLHHDMQWYQANKEKFN